MWKHKLSPGVVCGSGGGASGPMIPLSTRWRVLGQDAGGPVPKLSKFSFSDQTLLCFKSFLTVRSVSLLTKRNPFYKREYGWGVTWKELVWHVWLCLKATAHTFTVSLWRHCSAVLIFTRAQIEVSLQRMKKDSHPQPQFLIFLQHQLLDHNQLLQHPNLSPVFGYFE